MESETDEHPNHARQTTTAILILLALAGLPSSGSDQSVEICFQHNGLSCTTFMATDGERVFLGDSEDAGASHPLAKDPAGGIVFFLPASSTEYGRMHLGWFWQGKYRSFQAGMNDQGLAYALTAVPDVPMNRHPERPFLHGRDSFYDRILRNAATVDEAISLTLQFDFPSCWFQIQYADAAGGAAIISPGMDGELAITSRPVEADYLVASTFNVADPDQFIGRDSFRRHATASEMLARIADRDPFDVGSFSSVLDAVDRQRPYFLNGSYTVYSTAYDLTNREAYVYVLSRFDEPIHIDLHQALEGGEHTLLLKDEIPPTTLRSAITRYWVTQIGGAAGTLAVVGAVLYVLGSAVWSLIHR